MFHKQNVLKVDLSNWWRAYVSRFLILLDGFNEAEVAAITVTNEKAEVCLY